MFSGLFFLEGAFIPYNVSFTSDRRHLSLQGREEVEERGVFLCFHLKGKQNVNGALNYLFPSTLHYVKREGKLSPSAQMFLKQL